MPRNQYPRKENLTGSIQPTPEKMSRALRRYGHSGGIYQFFSSPDLLETLEKYIKFFDKKWGSPTYFDL